MAKVDLSRCEVELESKAEEQAALDLGYEFTDRRIPFDHPGTAEYAADQIEARASAQDERG